MISKEKYCLCCGVKLVDTRYGSFCKTCYLMTKSAQRRYDRLTNPHKRWAQLTISNHRTSGYIVNINRSELELIAEDTNVCQLCGQKLNWNNTKTSKNSPSLDRIDNENYLDINNIQIICHRCNVTKGSRTMNEFILYCKRIAKLYGE